MAWVFLVVLSRCLLIFLHFHAPTTEVNKIQGDCSQKAYCFKEGFRFHEVVILRSEISNNEGVWFSVLTKDTYFEKEPRISAYILQKWGSNIYLLYHLQDGVINKFRLVML